MITINEVQQVVTPILKKHKITKAALFGSIVSGKLHKKSDIDILVEAPKNYSIYDMLGLRYEIENKLNKKVDLVEFSSIKPRLKDSIISSQIKIIS
jgi:predicted nucleotidyltransferase